MSYDRHALDIQLDILYGSGDIEGWVTTRVHDPVADEVSESYFYWPDHREAVHDFVREAGTLRDIWLMPALFEEANGEVSNVKGTFVVWADCDKGVPSDIRLHEFQLGLPTLVVQSSLESKVHMYWRLKEFCTDLLEFQTINRNIAYALDADVGAWKGNHGLRAVGSMNHKYEEKHPVKILSIKKEAIFDLEADFRFVPVARSDEATLTNFNPMLIPDHQSVLLERSIKNPDLVDLLTKMIGEGSRSGALMRLAYGLCEEGLDDGEVFSVVRARAFVWGKFVQKNGQPRADADKQILSIVAKARAKIPYKVTNPAVEDATAAIEKVSSLPTGFVASDGGIQVYGMDDLIDYTEDMDWIIPGILPKRGILYLAGPPNVGKSVFAQEMALRLCMGTDFVGFAHPEGRRLRVLNLSLEMRRMSLKQRWIDLRSSLTEEEKLWAKENYLTYAEAYPLTFYNLKHLVPLATRVQISKPDVIFVDSATVSVAKKLSDEEQVKESLENMDQIREFLDCAIVMNAHTRKSIPGSGHKPKELDDLFGSAAIAANADSVIGLEREREKESEEVGLSIDVRFLKTRFKNDFSNSTSYPVIMDRGTGLMRKSGQIFNELIQAPVPSQSTAKKGPTARESFGFGL